MTRNLTETLVWQQRNWIAECGGSLAGYTARYGVQGGALFAADMRELRRYQAALCATVRHPAGYLILVPMLPLATAYLLVHVLSRVLWLAFVSLARLAAFLNTPEPIQTIRAHAPQAAPEQPHAPKAHVDEAYSLAQRISRSDTPDSGYVAVARKLLPITSATRAQREQP